jgi:hypothetical protein
MVAAGARRGGWHVGGADDVALWAALECGELQWPVCERAGQWGTCLSCDGGEQSWVSDPSCHYRRLVLFQGRRS